MVCIKRYVTEMKMTRSAWEVTSGKHLREEVALGLTFTRKHELEKRAGKNGFRRGISKWGNLWGDKVRQFESTVCFQKMVRRQM